MRKSVSSFMRAWRLFMGRFGHATAVLCRNQHARSREPAFELERCSSTEIIDADCVRFFDTPSWGCGADEQR